MISSTLRAWWRSLRQPRMTRNRRWAQGAGLEVLEDRLTPATLDLVSGVLTFNLDSTAAAVVSGTGSNLTFDAGAGNTFTAVNGAAALGFTAGGQTSTGDLSLAAVTQLRIVAPNGSAETLDLQGNGTSTATAVAVDLGNDAGDAVTISGTLDLTGVAAGTAFAISGTESVTFSTGQVSTTTGNVALLATASAASSIVLRDSPSAIVTGAGAVSLTSVAIVGEDDGLAEITTGGDVTLRAESIGGAGQIEIDGIAQAARVLTIDDTGSENVNVEVLTDGLFGRIDLTLSEGASDVDIALPGADFIDIDGGASSIVSEVVLAASDVIFDYTLTEAGCDLLIGTVTGGEGDLSFTNRFADIDFLGEVTVVDLSASARAITESEGSIVSTGLATFTADPTGDITLDRVSNDFYRLSIISGETAVVADSTGITLQDCAVSDVLAVSFAGEATIEGAIATVNGATLTGSDGADTLTIDYHLASVSEAGLTFDAGLGDDLLSVLGDGATTLAYYRPDASIPGDGIIDIGGVTTPHTLAFVSLAPIDLSHMALAVLELPNPDDMVTLADAFDFKTATAPALRVSGTSGGIAFETVAFFDNLFVVIDTASTDDDDTIDIDSATGAHGNVNLLIFTGFGESVVNINGDIALEGDLAISSEYIDIYASSITTGGEQTYDGAVYLYADVVMTTELASFSYLLDLCTHELVITGDLEFCDCVELIVKVAGPDDYGHIIVGGTAELGEALLTIDSCYSPGPSDGIVLINTNEGTFCTFLELPEKAIVEVGGVDLRITYEGGADHNDVILGQPPTITSAATTTFTAGVAGSFLVTTTGFLPPAITFTGALPVGVKLTDNGDGTATLGGVATVAGTYQITITASNDFCPDAVQCFTLIVRAGAAAAIVITAGNNQSTLVNTTFASRLQARVTDRFGNPLSGIVVAFHAPAAGPGGAFANGTRTITAVTDAAGLATTTVFRANAFAGPFAVTATAHAGSNPRTAFALANTLPLGARLVPLGPTTVAIQPTGYRFGVRLVNNLGQPIRNVAITFTVPVTGRFGRFAGGVTTVVVYTGIDGIAVAPLFVPSAYRSVYFTVLAQAGPLAVPFRAVNILSRMTRP